MKKINVVSPVYINKKVNFEGFIVDFNAEGKAVVEIEESQAEDFANVLTVYPNIYDADHLPADYNKKEVAKKEEVKPNNANTAEFDALKKGNIALAKENKELKKENETLKATIAELNAKLENKEENKEEKKEEKEENLEDTLNKKTLIELKSILADVYKDFQDEWKTLTKKDDIVKYILTKN